MRLFRHRKKSQEQTYLPATLLYQRETTENSLHWWETVRSLIDALSWFGQEVPPSAGSRRRRGDRLLSDDHQRLLLSFLVSFGLDRESAGVNEMTTPQATAAWTQRSVGAHNVKQCPVLVGTNLRTKLNTGNEVLMNDRVHHQPGPHRIGGQK